MNSFLFGVNLTLGIVSAIQGDYGWAAFNLSAAGLLLAVIVGNQR